MSSFDIIVGERWRGDEETLERLARYCERSKLLEDDDAITLPIRDVVEIVVDGLTVTARVPEDNVFLIVRDLVLGLERIASERQSKCFVAFQEGPWELCVARRGDLALISFYGTTPPRGVIIKDRPVPLRVLYEAASRTADRLARALSRVNGEIARYGPVAEMARAARRLQHWQADKTSSGAVAQPSDEASAGQRRLGGPWHEADPDHPFELCWWFDASDPFLLAYDGALPYDLHALLCRGQFGLRGGQCTDTPVDLPVGYSVHDLEGWVTATHHLVMSAEWGEKEAWATVSGERIRLSLAGRGHAAIYLGFRQGSEPAVVCPLTQLAAAVIDAGRGMHKALLDVNPRLARNQRLVDLRDEIEELAAWQADQDPVEASRGADTSRGNGDACRNGPPPEDRGGPAAEPIDLPQPAYADILLTRRDDAAPESSRDRGSLSGAARLRFAQRWRLEAEVVQLEAALPEGAVLVRLDCRLLCIENRDGLTRWRLPPANSRTATPTADGSAIVSTTGGRLVYIRSEDGATAWEVPEPTNGKTTLVTRPLRIPVAGRTHLAIGTGGGRLLLLDEATGRRRWEFTGRKGDRFRLAAGGRHLYLVSAGGTVYALNLEDGQLAWRLKLRARTEHAPLIRGGLVLLCTRESPSAEGRVIALDALTGEQRWQREVGTSIGGAPLLWDDLLLVSVQHAEGACLAALCPSNGSLLWRRELGSVGVAPPSAPIRAGESVVVKNDGGLVLAFDPATGEQRWSRSLAGGIVPDVLRNPAPRLARDAVFAAYDAVYVLNPADGKVIHRLGDAGIPDDIRVDPAGRVYVCEEGDHLSAFELTTVLHLVHR